MSQYLSNLYIGILELGNEAYLGKDYFPMGANMHSSSSSGAKDENSYKYFKLK